MGAAARAAEMATPLPTQEVLYIQCHSITELLNSAIMLHLFLYLLDEDITFPFQRRPR